MESIICDLERHRTRGDGMEEEQLNGNKEIVIQNENDGNRQIGHRATSANVAEYVHRKTSTNSLLPLPGLHSLYRRSEGGSRRLAPVTPKGELIQMTPHLAKPATRISKHQISNVPKFIPYEPYPGATIPIVSSGVTKKELTKVEKVDKNNLDIGILVGQMSTLRTQELDEKNRIKTESSTALDQKLEKLTEDLRRTKEERDYFQGQFRFQTQVNSELKNLLIASVGEDLQTHVNGLTEDKLQLARALLDTANNLTTHTEQIEFLAGQCEVWRSKFLASSVMVEELARWKADLTHKNQILNESVKRLLHATDQVREMQLEILRNLKFVAKIRYLNLPATDMISLSAENLNIVQQMVLHSGFGIPEGDLNISSASKNPLSDAEKYAVKALQFISQPLMATDDAIKALFEQVQRPYIQTTAGKEVNTIK